MNAHKISKKVSKKRKFNTLLVVASLFLPAALAASSPAALAAEDTETKPIANEGIVLPPGPIGETWRKKPPTLPAPRPFAMAKAAEFKLENGLQVELIPDHRVPFITIALGIKAGSCFDPPEKSGLADMTADLLTEGTEARKSKEIADQVDFIGGGLKGVTDPDFTLLSGSALSKYSDKLFDLFTDVLLHPTFPEDELSLKKTNLIEELAMKRSEPEFLVEERYHKMLFGEHPYGIVAPSPASVKSLTRTDVQQYHQTHYLPNESVLVVVGDFEEAKIKELIQNQFGAGWKKGTMPVPTMPALPKQNGRRIYLVNRPGSVQSNIRLGNIAISKSDPNYFPMVLANEVLGGATQARLFLNIREQKGYTYGAYSGLTARRQPGSFTAEAEVRTEVTAPSLEEFLYELDRIRNVKVSDKELKDAKSYLIGSFQLGLETQSGLAQRLLESKLYDLPEDYLRTYSDKVMAVTPDDIRAAARKMIDLNNVVITIVGDADKVQKDLQYFGPVEVYDTSGAMSTDSKKATTGS
ncbi:MAG TPA: pitrilysin family protein [Oculatellaceae cyanobacterium]